SERMVVARAGAWTLLGLGGQPNPVFNDFLTEIRSRQNPFSRTMSNLWLDAEFDPRSALSAGANWPPHFSVKIGGDGKNVRLRGEMKFSQPIPLTLDPWNVPTNLIHDPLSGFMAIRGSRLMLRTSKPWDELRLGEPPN